PRDRVRDRPIHRNRARRNTRLREKARRRHIRWRLRSAPGVWSKSRDRSGAASSARARPRICAQSFVFGWSRAKLRHCRTMPQARPMHRSSRPGHRPRLGRRRARASRTAKTREERAHRALVRRAARSTTAAATTSASMRRSTVMRSRATDGMSASECQGKRPDQAVKHRSDGRECREPSTLSHLGFQPVQKTPTIHVSSGFIWGIPVMKTKGRARGARRVEGTGITNLRPFADSLATYARQIHSIAEIVRVQLEMLEARSIEEESAEQSTEAKAAENTAPCSPHDGQQHLTSTLPTVGWRPLPVISDTLDRTPVIEAHAAPIVDTISPEAICQRVLGARKSAEARAIEWMPDRLCAMEQNSVRASDGKLLLAPKV